MTSSLSADDLYKYNPNYFNSNYDLNMNINPKFSSIFISNPESNSQEDFDSHLNLYSRYDPDFNFGSDSQLNRKLNTFPYVPEPALPYDSDMDLKNDSDPDFNFDPDFNNYKGVYDYQDKSVSNSNTNPNLNSNLKHDVNKYRLNKYESNLYKNNYYYNLSLIIFIIIIIILTTMIIMFFIKKSYQPLTENENEN